MDETGHMFSELVVKMTEGEHEIENIRISLATQDLFNPKSLFDILGRIYKNSISLNDLIEFLEENRGTVRREDVELVIIQYSTEENSRLSFENFCNLVLPATDPISRNTALSRLYYYDIDWRIKQSFKGLLIHEASLLRKIERLKIGLFGVRGFSVWKLFEAINTSGNRCINSEDLKEFLARFNITLLREDICAFMRRIGLENFSVITYNEFLAGIRPRFLAGEEVNDYYRIFQNLENEEIEKELKPESKKPEVFCFNTKAGRNFIRFQDEIALNSHKEKLLDVLVSEVKAERKYEFLKQTLIMQVNFSVRKLFDYIDPNKKGEIQIEDFGRFLRKLGINATQEIISRSFKKFFKKISGLRFEEFMNAFLCQDDEYNEFLKYNDPGEDLSVETLDLIAEFFGVFVDKENEIHQEKMLFGDYEKSFQNFFETFRLGRRVGVNEFRQALECRGFVVGKKDLGSLVSRYLGNEENFN